MSRVAGQLSAFAIALVVPFGSAAGQGASQCRGPEVVVAHYQEQVCQRGTGGYATCRWIERRHIVRAPRRCATTLTSERARPATRGAFPPYRRTASRG